MQRLILLLFTSIFLFEFLQQASLLPRVFNYVPELLSALCLFAVVMMISTRRNALIRFSYVSLFLVLGVEMLLGAVVNSAPSGAMFAGLRNYFKYIPFFFLPMVFRFTEKDFNQQLKLLAFFSLLQFPVVLYQRFVISKGLTTGDLVVGTLAANSGALSIYLISAMSIIYAFYLKGEIKMGRAAIIMAMLGLPTMLNETKITLFMLPLMAVVPVLSMEPGAARRAALRMSFAIIGLFLLLFIPIYDYFIWERYGYGIVTFFTMDDRLSGYLASELSGGDLREQIGKVDALIQPFKYLSDDPAQLIFGVGIGNISESFLGSRFAGEYLLDYGHLIAGSISKMIWEIGVAGFLIVLIIMFMIARDALLVKRLKSSLGSLALGWTAVVLVILVGLSHSEIASNNAISYVFWYLSGHIVAKSSELRTRYRITSYSHVQNKSVSG